MPVEITRRIGTTITSSATLTTGQHTPVDASAAGVTVTLPTGANVGASLSIEKIDATTNAVTITGSMRGTATTLTLTGQYETLELRADSAGSWRPYANHLPKAVVTNIAAPIRGNRIATLGDSLNSLNGTNYNVTAGRQFQNNYGWFIAAGLKGRVRLTGQYGYPSQTIATIRDSALPVVLALPDAQKPGTVIVLAGTNDVSSGITAAQSMTALDGIYTGLRNAGIRMICCTIPPRSDDTTANGNVGRFNMAIRKFAADRGLALLPFHSALVDPTTGGYLAAYNNGDGIHPSPAGMAAMADAAIGSGIADSFPVGQVETAASILDPTDLLAGGGLNLTDSNTDGLADVWNFNGGAATATTTLLTPTVFEGVVGKWQRFTTTGGTAGQQHYFQAYATVSSNVGDLISLTGRFRVTGATAAGFPASQPITFGVDERGGSGYDGTTVGTSIDRDGFFNCEIRATAAATSFVTSVTTWAPGNATIVNVDVAQVAVRNLTALGLA